MAFRTIPAHELAVKLTHGLQQINVTNRSLASLLESIEAGTVSDPVTIAKSLRLIDEQLCDSTEHLRRSREDVHAQAQAQVDRGPLRFHSLGAGDGILSVAFNPADDVRDILYSADDVSEGAEVILQVVAKKGTDSEDARLMAAGARTLLSLHRAMLAEQSARAEEQAAA